MPPSDRLTKPEATARDFRLGLVGCGRVAERGYVPAAARVRGLRLTAVADAVAERCARVAPGLPAHTSAEALLSAHVLDGLVLATPAHAHLSDARLAAGARLPTLVEKPPAPDVASAAELARLEPAPWIGLNRRFARDFRRLRSAIPAGRAAELTLELHVPGDWAAHVVDDDALLDLGPHAIDLARWLTNSDVDAVRAPVIEAASAEVDLALERGRARISLAIGRPFREAVTARVAGRVLVAGHSTTGLVGRARRMVASDSLVACLARQLRDFVRAARQEPANALATAADGLAVMAVIDAARRSAAEGGTRMAVPRVPSLLLLPGSR